MTIDHRDRLVDEFLVPIYNKSNSVYKLINIFIFLIMPYYVFICYYLFKYIISNYIRNIIYIDYLPIIIFHRNKIKNIQLNR